MDAVIGVGAGGVDELMLWQDERGGRVDPFKTWTDWSRVGLCALGYLGQAFNFFPRFAQPLAQSEVTLVTKSAVSAIRAQTGAGRRVTKTRAGYTPATPSDKGRVGWRPKAIGV